MFVELAKEYQRTHSLIASVYENTPLSLSGICGNLQFSKWRTCVLWKKWQSNDNYCKKSTKMSLNWSLNYNSRRMLKCVFPHQAQSSNLLTLLLPSSYYKEVLIVFLANINLVRFVGANCNLFISAFFNTDNWYLSTCSLTTCIVPLLQT